MRIDKRSRGRELCALVKGDGCSEDLWFLDNLPYVVDNLTSLESWLPGNKSPGDKQHPHRGFDKINQPALVVIGSS
ncbi:MAG: hypothetical protein WBB69_13205 [Anaerolineales bacterium]